MRFKSFCASAASAEKTMVTTAKASSGVARCCIRPGKSGISKRRNP